jgi:hypothetical protein
MAWPDPMRRVRDRERAVRRQAATCAAFLAALLAAGRPAAGPAVALALSAAAVETALAGALLGLRRQRRRCARDLLISGGDADGAEVEAERRRLLAAGTRRRLARRLECSPAAAAVDPYGAVVTGVARALRAGACDVRAVAMVDLLLERAGDARPPRSALPGLGEDLNRIAFELGVARRRRPC